MLRVCAGVGAMATVVLLICAGGCEKPAASVPAGPKAWGAVPAVAPVAFFANHCASCHGDDGKDYPVDSPLNRDMARLEAKLREMVSAHGKADGAKFTSADWAAQKSFHLAAVERKPFIAVTSHTWPEPGEITGETVHGKRLELIVGLERGDVWIDDDGRFVIKKETMEFARKRVTNEEWLDAELLLTGENGQTRLALKRGSTPPVK